MTKQDNPEPLSAAEITGWQQFWEKNRPTAGFASTINLVWLEEFGDQLFAIIESQRAEILKLERDWDAVREAHDARQAENAQLRERVAELEGERRELLGYISTTGGHTNQTPQEVEAWWVEQRAALAEGGDHD